MKGVMFRKHIDRASVARLIFTNRERTTIHVTINDTIHKVYNPEPGPEVQQIDIHTPIRSLEVRIANPAGFIGYGIVFENKNGVSLDNYSIRGNSGLALFGTNAAVNARIGAMRGYDLIILQYGLNVMSADVLHYGSYEKAFIKVINYMKRCFPNSSILVMGVCDRSTQRDGEFVTMPAVRGMIEAQRNAARETGVAFWNTFEAMGGRKQHGRVRPQELGGERLHPPGLRRRKFIAGKLVGNWMQGVEAEQQRRDRIEEERRKNEMLHYNRNDTIPGTIETETETDSDADADTTFTTNEFAQP